MFPKPPLSYINLDLWDVPNSTTIYTDNIVTKFTSVEPQPSVYAHLYFGDLNWVFLAKLCKDITNFLAISRNLNIFKGL